MPKKTELQMKLEEAAKNGNYLVAVWTLKDNVLDMFRITQAFPVAEYQGSIKLLEKDLLNLKD